VLTLFDIAQFPTPLQPMIQQGYLETSFEDALTAVNGYWVAADQGQFTEEFEKNRGTTITKTRMGYKPPMQVPADPTAAQTAPNDGVTASDPAIEQYTLSPQEFTDGSDMDLIGTNFAIVNRFKKYVRGNQHQAIQSVDILARDTYISGYAVGCARVTAIADAGSGVAVHVDDIRGLSDVITVGSSSTNGVLKPVSTTNKLPVTFLPAGSFSGAFEGNVEGAAADGTNASHFALVGAGTSGTPLSTRGNGVSGTITIDTLPSNLAVGDIVVAGDAPRQYIGASGVSHWSLLSSADANLASAQLLDAVGDMRDNGIPYAQNDEGDSDETFAFHCSPSVMRSIFNDSDFKQANQTLGQSPVYKGGKVSQYLGVTFMPNTNAPKIPLSGGGFANLSILTGQGALIDSWYAGLEDWVYSQFNPGYVSLERGIAQILMPAYAHRQGRGMTMDWLTIRDMTAPTDVTRTSVILSGTGSRRARAAAIWTYSAT
jgi:hypothetical protein